MKTKYNNPYKPPLLWQLPLAAVFLCFGMLLMSQYYTHVDESTSLKNQSTEDLAMIVKTVNDNKQSLEAELATLEAELNTLEEAVASGENLTSSVHSHIDNVQTALGTNDVNGTGITLTITNESNLIYQDIIDIVNELFNSGAEAVSINDTRFTIYTQIYEEAFIEESIDEESGQSETQERYAIMLDGKQLRSPIVIKALGNPEVLTTALTYPGGIISNLTTLYGMNPTIRQAANLVIPNAERPAFEYAQPVEEDAAE